MTNSPAPTAKAAPIRAFMPWPWTETASEEPPEEELPEEDELPEDPDPDPEPEPAATPVWEAEMAPVAVAACSTMEEQEAAVLGESLTEALPLKSQALLLFPLEE